MEISFWSTYKPTFMHIVTSVTKNQLEYFYMQT
jgi:hypothetical protein